MKIALGMIVENEEEMLKRHLKLVSSCFEGAVILDDRSEDQTQMVIGKEIECKFDLLWPQISQYGYADKRNWVIREAERLFYDGLVFLDADECMFPSDIDFVKNLLTIKEAIMLPRYEFGPTPEFYNPTLYPDNQGRAFRLNQGFEYRNNLHEILYEQGHEQSVYEEQRFYCSHGTHIYHYGRCKDPKEIWLRYHNYDRIKAGLEKITEIPEGINIDLSPNYKDVIKFEGRQPLCSQ